MIRTALVALLSVLFLSTAVAGNDARQTDCMMDKDALMEQVMTSGELMLPQFRIYNAQGHLLKGLGKFYSPGRVGSLLNEARKATSGDAEKKLEDELAHVTLSDGSALESSPDADLYVVKLWAEWCKPCHELTAELEAYLEKHPDLDIHVFNIEADPMKGQDVGKN